MSSSQYPTPGSEKAHSSYHPRSPKHRNEDALQNQEDLLVFAQRIFERSNMGFFEWFNPSNRFRYSQSFERMLGYQAGELDLSEASIASHIYSEDFHALVKLLGRSAVLGEDLEMQLRLRNKQGELRWHQLQMVVYSLTGNGHTKTALGCVTDIHEIKTAQEEILRRSQLEQWLTSTTRDLLVDEKPGAISRCLNALCQQFDIDFCVLRHVQNEETEFCLVDFGCHPLKRIPTKLSAVLKRENLPFDADVFLAGNAHVVDNVETESTMTEELKANFVTDPKSFAAIPIFYHGKLEYFLSLVRLEKARDWTPETLRATQLMGDAVALVAARQWISKILFSNEERFQHALDATQDGILDWNIAKQEFTVTHTFLYMLGYDEELLPLTEEKINQFFFAPTSLTTFFDQNRLDGGGTMGRLDLIIPMRHRNGKTIWVNARTKHTEWDEKGNPTRCVGEIKDISVYKHTQRQLIRKAQADLQLLQTQSTMINQWRRKLEFMSDALCEEIDAINHNARSLDEVREFLIQHFNQSINLFSRASNESNYTIDSELFVKDKFFQQVATQKDSTTVIDVDELFDSLAEHLQPLAKDNEVHLVVDVSEDLSDLIKGGRSILFHSIRELTNYFIGELSQTTLYLSVSLLRLLDQRAQLQICWNSECHCQGIFEKQPFYQLLNYFIHLDSDVTFTSDERKGFYFSAVVEFGIANIDLDRAGSNWLKVSDEQRAAQGGVNGVKPGDNDVLLANTTVLLAEDNPINQKVAVSMLQRKGITVTVVNNGQEALDILNKENNHKFDLVLMDMDMPVLDGYQATTAIRANPKLSHIPVMAVTAHTSNEDKQKSYEAGVVDHIAKPLKPKLLFDGMIRVLKQNRKAAT